MNSSKSGAYANRNQEKKEDGDSPELFLPESLPFGISFGEWTIRWWRWCLSQPNATNPVNAKRDANNGGGSQIIQQPYPEVWFLVGTTGGYIERESSIAQDRAILCPIINFEISTAEDSVLKTDEELIEYARADVDKIARLDLIIDGKRVPNIDKYRVASGAFDIVLPEDNIWGTKPGPTRAAADGYWLFLKPFSKETRHHQIQFGGSCLAGTVKIGTTYYLTIV